MPRIIIPIYIMFYILYNEYMCAWVHVGQLEHSYYFKL